MPLPPQGNGEVSPAFREYRLKKIKFFKIQLFQKLFQQSANIFHLLQNVKFKSWKSQRRNSGRRRSLKKSLELKIFYRFRYKSEMQGTHGCIHGKNYSKKSKKFPEVQIVNVPQELNTVTLRVALYTNETPRRHHVHKIMMKKSPYESEQDFIEVRLDRSKGFKQVWEGLGIIHTARRFNDETIFNRIRKVFLEQKGAKEGNPYAVMTDADEMQLKSDAAKMGKEITDKLNTVVLGFEAFKVEAGIYYPLCSMAFTNPINNLKNPSTGDLKICRISAFVGSVSGGDEIFIFIERVKKGDIQVRFFELDENEERVWEELATFSENDVHHQYAIAFK